MRPHSLACMCGVRVEGPIEVNEFAGLPAEQLHFLRIFVMFEGRIRDMETALGVSYPTIKARISDLKQHLNLDSTVNDEVDDVLTQLETGELDASEAINRLT
jgi:hypothetical protein